MPILSKEREFPIVDVDGETLEPFPEDKKKIPEGDFRKVEKGIRLRKDITHRGQVLVTSPAARKIKITLPVTAQAFANPKNWHKPISFAVRWLLTFVRRQLKRYPGQTVFKK